MDADNIFSTPLREVNLHDPDGHKTKNWQLEGTNFYFPPFPGMDDYFRKFPDISARADDVLICGYAKSGTHWVWEVVSMLLQGTAEYIPRIKEQNMIEGIEPADLAPMPSPRVLNSHLPMKYLPPDFLRKQCKIVYLLRNPKDLMVSLYNHTYNLLPFYGYEGQWNGFFELFMAGRVDYGNWFEYVQQWERDISMRKDHPIHVWYYEDMKMDPESEVRRLASFLGVVQDEYHIKKVVDRCSFKSMRNAKAEFNSKQECEDWRNGQPMMYRKGEVGDWKNWFTVLQNEQLDSAYRDQMTGTKLKFTYVQ